MSFSYVGDFFRKMEPISLLVTTLSCTLLICNLVGNVLVMLVICKNKKQSVSANAFLLSSLACSDLELAIVIFFYTIFLTYRVTEGNFPDFIFHALISVYTLVALAVERYYAILKPFVHLTRMVKSFVKKVIFAVWIFAAHKSSKDPNSKNNFLHKRFHHTCQVNEGLQNSIIPFHSQCN